jgi:two-component system phosphate regulon sensor histidine kinase PhoR
MSKSLKFKLLFPTLSVILLLFVLSAFFTLRGFRRFYIDALTRNTGKQLILEAEVYPDSLLSDTRAAAVQEYCLFLDKRLELRVTVIDTAGMVLGDSRVLPESLSTLENHGTRPEILGLRKTPFQSQLRYSATRHTDMLYLACRVERHGRTAAYLRFAFPLEEINAYLFKTGRRFLLLEFLAFVVLAVIMRAFSTRIESIIREISQNAGQLERGKSFTGKYTGYAAETDALYARINEAAERITGLIGNLKRQNEEMQALLISVSEGVIAVNEDLKVLFANENARNMFGSSIPYRPDIPVPLIGLTHSEEMEEIARTAVAKKQKHEADLLLQRGARQYELKILCSPIRLGPKGGGPVILMTIIDLTEARHTARIKTDFVEAASHELKTPLSILKGYLETLEGGPEPDMRARSLSKMKSGLDRLEAVLNDLTTLSYLERGKTALPLTAFSPQALVNEIIEDLKPAIAEKKLSMDVSCIPEMQGAQELIYMVLYNLISNAVRYNRPGGTVQIRIASGPAAYQLTVADSGIGIAPEFRDRVFERFFRVDKHRSRSEGGTGLGLAIVKHIMNTLKGTVRIEDGIQGGVSFMVHLPFSSPAGE